MLIPLFHWLVYIILVGALFAKGLLLFIVIARFSPSGVEQIMRSIAAVCGLLLCLGAKAVGLSVPMLLLGALTQSGAYLTGFLGALMPAALGFLVSFFVVRFFNSRNARKNLVQAQTDYAASRYDYIVSVLQLRLAAGNLDRTQLTEIGRLVPGTRAAVEGEIMLTEVAYRGRRQLLTRIARRVEYPRGPSRPGEGVELRLPPVVVAIAGRCGADQPAAVGQPVIFVDEELGW